MDENATQAVPMFPWQECPDERMRVDDWRLHQLLRGGYPLDEASRIAIRTDLDLHEAVALVAAGCPPVTAAKILL